MCVDDSMHDREPKPRPFRSRGKERVEHPIADLFGNARAGIANLEYHVRDVSPLRISKFPTAKAHHQTTRAIDHRHGFAGISDQVQ